MASKQNETLKITNEMSLYLRFLHQEEKGTSLTRSFQGVTLNIQIEVFTATQKKKSLLKCLLMAEKQIRDDHQKMTKHSERLILRTIKGLRNANTSFTVQTLRKEAGLKHTSTRTVNRYLNKHKSKSLQSRKKGLLTGKDKKKRL